jgi:hypothetical protein
LAALLVSLLIVNPLLHLGGQLRAGRWALSRTDPTRIAKLRPFSWVWFWADVSMMLCWLAIDGWQGRINHFLMLECPKPLYIRDLIRVFAPSGIMQIVAYESINAEVLAALAH